MAACVGPALTQQSTSTTPGHMGFDICAAIAFLIKNCGEVFAEAPGCADSSISAETTRPRASDASAGGLAVTVPARAIAEVVDRGRSRGLHGEGTSAPLSRTGAQENSQRPGSPRLTVGRPQRMDNLLTSIAGGPRNAHAGTAVDGRDLTGNSKKLERGRSCRQRSRPPSSQSPVWHPINVNTHTL